MWLLLVLCLIMKRVSSEHLTYTRNAKAQDFHEEYLVHKRKQDREQMEQNLRQKFHHQGAQKVNLMKDLSDRMEHHDNWVKQQVAKIEFLVESMAQLKEEIESIKNEIEIENNETSI
jgi:hypothetical protein